MNALKRWLLVVVGTVLLTMLIVLGTLRLTATATPASDGHLTGPCRELIPYGDNIHIISANSDGTASLWSIHRERIVRRYRDEGAVLYAACMSPEHDSLIASMESQGQVYLAYFDLATGSLIERHSMAQCLYHSLNITSDGMYLVGSAEDVVYICRPDGMVIRSLAHDGSVNDVIVSPDGRHILTASGDYSGGTLHDAAMRVWNVETGELVVRLDHGDWVVNAVAVSADGTLAASGDYGGRIRLWDTSDWSLYRELEMGMDVNALSFSPDSSHILAGGGKARVSHLGTGTVRMWMVVTGEMTDGFEGEMSAARSVAFAKDGRLAMSAHGYFEGEIGRDGLIHSFPADMLIRVWDTETGMIRNELDLANPVSDLE